MARRRSTARAVETGTRNGLPEAFPSAPTRLPIVFLYITDAEGRQYHQGFSALYPARHLIRTVTGDKFTWRNRATIVTEHGVVISTTTSRSPSDGEAAEMEAVVEYELSRAEEEWEIPDPYLRLWCRLADAPQKERSPVIAPEPAKKAPTERLARPKAEPKRRVSSADIITAVDIASELKLPGSKVREALRRSSMVKPDGGWQWPSVDKDRIIAIIKENLK